MNKMSKFLDKKVFSPHEECSKVKHMPLSDVPKVVLIPLSDLRHEPQPPHGC